MQKEYFVVKTGKSYHMIALDTHMKSEDFSTLFLINSFDHALEIAKEVDGNVYELTIVEEKVL